MYNTLSVINNPCKILPVLLNKTYSSTYNICPTVLKSELNINSDYRLGYPRGISCATGRGSSAVLRSPCNAQETYLTETKSLSDFLDLSRQVSLLGVRRVSLAPGLPANHTNPLPASPSYPLGVRGQRWQRWSILSPLPLPQHGQRW